jgi:hypothetical protein
LWNYFFPNGSFLVHPDAVLFHLIQQGCMGYAQYFSCFADAGSGFEGGDDA